MDTNFEQVDFGPLKPYLEDDDVTDISYDNSGQIHLKTLSRGIFRVDNPAINNAFIEKLAFQCSNVMGKTFNMAHPFLDAESAELRLAFIHETVSRNGIACVLRKTPAKIRLQKDKIVADKYVELDIIDFLEQCVLGHCNIIVSGETGSGKTELVKYLASKIADNEKIITVEDTLELHLDKIFPHRDIVAMKTNNIASYTDILEACMRQNPKWILLSEVRSAEAVMAVRNSISSGHYILSTIHADKAASIPNRMYSLLETNQDLNQFLSSICRYIQLGIYVRGFTDKATHNFKREIAEVTEFYVTNDTNEAKSNTIYRKGADGKVIRNNPSLYLIDYLEVQGVFLPKELQNIGGDSEEDSMNIQAPLSESEIADNQTVTFSNNGARVSLRKEEVNDDSVNPIEMINGASSVTDNVSEISYDSKDEPSTEPNVYDEMHDRVPEISSLPGDQQSDNVNVFQSAVQNTGAEVIQNEFPSALQHDVSSYVNGAQMLSQVGYGQGSYNTTQNELSTGAPIVNYSSVNVNGASPVQMSGQVMMSQSAYNPNIAQEVLAQQATNPAVNAYGDIYSAQMAGQNINQSYSQPIER